ncbi:hypothetical protein HanIR_Chr11g0520031 [Helianthus annuus]|nr:hypothetical protein HanIR_Chr11g0520031 [Helianthus annuus]
MLPLAAAQQIGPFGRHLLTLFWLLTKYCVSKYESVVQSLLSQGCGPSEMAVMGSDAAKAISREMPIELLRASLPHTNENQRKVLLDFAQRSMPVHST